MTEPGPGADPSVTAKIVAILDAFRPSTTEMSLNELARRSGLAVSTAYRHASKLVELGALEKDDDGGYRIGLRLWEIASLARRGLSLRDIAVPFMLELYEATHENVHLAVLDGYEALYVEKTTGRRSVQLKSKEAGRLPLHATGVGKIMLAYAEPDFVDEVIGRGLARYTAHTIVAPVQLQRALADVRRNGYAQSGEELTLGTISVAAPIMNRGGVVVAALSLVGRSNRVDLGRLAPAVRTSALGISRQLSQSAYGTATWSPSLLPDED